MRETGRRVADRSAPHARRATVTDGHRDTSTPSRVALFAGSTADSVLELQRSAGNRATTLAIQRAPAGLATTALRPPLVHGSRGEGVRKLQQRLNLFGATPLLAVDGAFGQKTVDAVVAFQTDHFDDPKEWDGKVGSKTWDQLDAAYGAPPELSADEKETGEHVKEKTDQLNMQPATADSGVWYDYNYQDRYPDKFTSEMQTGMADHNVFDKEGYMTWRVKPRVSAASALQSWLRGLTIAECYTALQVAEFDTVRKVTGNEKFDETFGSSDKALPKASRLLITPPQSDPTAASQMERLFKSTEAAVTGDAGTAGDRPAKVGEWYYFMNHPKYLLKHPAGAWQGENSIYMGREGTASVQMWAGLGTSGGTGPSGASHVTEDQMLAEMVNAYNRPRDDRDAARLKDIAARNGGTLPPVLDPANGLYPETLTGPDEILGATPEKLVVPGFMSDTFDRKGGFFPSAGRTLDLDKLKAMRDG